MVADVVTECHKFRRHVRLFSDVLSAHEERCRDSLFGKVLPELTGAWAGSRTGGQSRTVIERENQTATREHAGTRANA